MMLFELISGAIVGLFLGATGAGAGSLLTPILLLLGHRPEVAVAAGIVTLIITKGSGAIVHHQLNHWPPRFVMAVVAGGVIGVGLLSLALRTGDVPPRLLQQFVAVIAIFVAIAPSVIHRVDRPSDDSGRWYSFAMVGAVIGAIVAITSAGSGTLLVMALLRKTKWTASQLAAMSNIFGMAVGIAALAAYGRHYALDTRLIVSVIAGALPGTVIGALLSRRFSRDRFEIFFRVLTFSSGVALLLPR
jgi:uncharacterized protein